MKNRKQQRPSDERVAGRTPTQGEVKAALAILDKVRENLPKRPPVKR